jgi:hypothetical protein
MALVILSMLAARHAINRLSSFFIYHPHQFEHDILKAPSNAQVHHAYQQESPFAF